MTTIPGMIRDGQIHPGKPLAAIGERSCLITIIDEDLEELHRLSEAILEEAEQERLSALLQSNKSGGLTEEQERELNALLTEVYRLAAKRARAARLLEQLHLA
jgi:hypothetical protein